VAADALATGDRRPRRFFSGSSPPRAPAAAAVPALHALAVFDAESSAEAEANDGRPSWPPAEALLVRDMGIDWAWPTKKSCLARSEGRLGQLSCFTWL